jgi:Fe-S oxidoreductase
MKLILEMMSPLAAHIILYALFIGSVLFFAVQLLKRIKEVKKGKKENRIDQIGKRIKAFFTYVIFQKRLFRDPWPGIAHAFIFWGFVILAIGYGIFFITAREVHESFLVGLLGGGIINIYLFLQDLFAFLVLLGVLFGLFNHYIRRYKRLDNSFDAAFILTLILLIVVAFFVTGGLREVITESHNSLTPFTNIAASIFRGLSDAAAQTVYFIAFWLHAIFILGFLVYLPSSKHLHLVISEFNVFFMNLKPRGQMRHMDLEEEESYGANSAAGLSWRSLLDAYACVECGRCMDACPAYNTDKALNPKKIINNLRDYLDDTRTKPESDKPKQIITKYTTKDEIWACTTCYACQQECPILIEHLDKIIEYRRNLVLMEADMPSELNQFFKNLETRFNPWPIGKDARADWAEDLPIKKFSSDNKSAEYLFFVGCAAALDERNIKVATSFVKLLDKAGVDAAILGVKEKCCGEPARRLGNEYLYQMMAMENIETFSQYDFKKIITMCPHCYNTLKNEYSQMGAEYEVIHHTQILKKLIQKGKLKPEKAVEKKITFHDSCYLGRYNSIYKEPRASLKAIPGVKFMEMKKNCSFSFCCGGGGGRMWLEETEGTRINHERINQAAELEPDALISACPYCLTMFSDGIAETNRQETLEALDIAELIEKSI